MEANLTCTRPPKPLIGDFVPAPPFLMEKTFVSSRSLAFAMALGCRAQVPRERVQSPYSSRVQLPSLWLMPPAETHCSLYVSPRLVRLVRLSPSHLSRIATAPSFILSRAKAKGTKSRARVA